VICEKQKTTKNITNQRIWLGVQNQKKLNGGESFTSFVELCFRVLVAAAAFPIVFVLANFISFFFRPFLSLIFFCSLSLSPLYFFFPLFFCLMSF